jgi:hypothetical protein
MANVILANSCASRLKPQTDDVQLHFRGRIVCRVDAPICEENSLMCKLRRNALLSLLVLSVVVLAPRFSLAQDKADERVANYRANLSAGCSAELNKYCKDIADGEGRLLACLYAHEPNLSDRCGNLVTGALERLGVALGALATVVRVCQGDAQRLCNGMIAGHGSLVGCLSNAKKSVSAQCNATLDAALLNGIGDR